MGEEMLFLGHGFPGLKTARIDLDGCKIELPDLDDVFFEEVSAFVCCGLWVSSLEPLLCHYRRGLVTCHI